MYQLHVVLSARHESRIVSTVKMVRGNERSNAKKLRGSPSRLGKALLAHYLTFAIRARQRLLEMDDCLASPAPPRRRRHTGGATWVDVRCRCERLRHYLKNPSTTLPAESSQRSALLFDRRPRSARAGRKCRAIPPLNFSSSSARPPSISPPSPHPLDPNPSYGPAPPLLLSSTAKNRITSTAYPSVL